IAATEPDAAQAYQAASERPGDRVRRRFTRLILMTNRLFPAVLAAFLSEGPPAREGAARRAFHRRALHGPSSRHRSAGRAAALRLGTWRRSAADQHWLRTDLHRPICHSAPND